VVSEAELEQTNVGLVPRSTGWFVLNARDARWWDKPGQGHSCPLTGDDKYEAETLPRRPAAGLAHQKSDGIDPWNCRRRQPASGSRGR
jgi:hypothetical protein